jgi:putative membrane protein
VEGAAVVYDYLERKYMMKRINLLIFGFLLPLLSGFMFYSWGEAFEGPARYGDWHMGPGMMGSWGMGGFGMIFMMVFWVLVIVGLIALVKWLIPSKKDEKAGSLGAIEILKQRYARGEIDQVEFETQKRALAD